MYKCRLERKHKLQATSELNNGNTWIKKKNKTYLQSVYIKKNQYGVK